MSTTTDRAVPSIDLSGLPRTVFGHRGTPWWATVGFMTIEATTLIITMVSYVYLRRNFVSWPPPPTPLPDLLLPTINLLVILAIMVPMQRVSNAARRFDLAGARRWFVIAVALTVLALVLRVWDFAALNTRWDASAYGSAAWLIIGFHTTLLIVDLLESGTMAALTFTERVEPKHFADFDDAALYQYFLSLIWVPVYVLVYLGPRFF